MRMRIKCSQLLVAAVLSASCVLLGSGAGSALTYKTLHNFNSGSDGYWPVAGLLSLNGNLYGVATYGGNSNGGGTIFELQPNGSGGWTYSVLYDFCSQSSCTDGAYPQYALIADASGNLYGTTYAGGSSTICAGGCGTVFKFDPSTSAETVLWSFTSGSDGSHPSSGLSHPGSTYLSGALYGTAYNGTTNGGGTLYKLNPSSMTLTTLHTFTGISPEGANPAGGVVFDSTGDMFGTTVNGGGSFNVGSVYEYSSSSAFSTIYDFCSPCSDGSGPSNTPLLLSSTQIIGTTSAGGANSYGEIYELDNNNMCGQPWCISVLYSFCSYTPNCYDGRGPGSVAVGGLPLVWDGSSYWGITPTGGVGCTGSGPGCGTVFSYSGGSGDPAVYRFNLGVTGGGIGKFPTGGLVQDSAGIFYGVTQNGGTGSCSGGCGIVFEISP